MLKTTDLKKKTGKMGVLIEDRQRVFKISLEKIQSEAQIILNALDCPEGELSVLIVDDTQIAELNQQYLNRQGPTNVLAFPMSLEPFSEETPQILGDVVISVDTAENEGKIAGISTERRLRELLVHGILHLFNYDHEKTDEAAWEMDQKNTALLSLIEAETTANT
ncbi:MAG: rRNA maturation RNase YbeY [Desulfobacterales bacterium]